MYPTFQALLLPVFVLRRDCGYFEMECPEFASAAELKEDLEKYESMWGVFEAFNSELAVLRKEDWISFRFNCTTID